MSSRLTPQGLKAMVAESTAVTPDVSAQALRERIRNAALQDESSCLKDLLESLSLSASSRTRAQEIAEMLVSGTRSRSEERSILDSFLQQFALSNEEGVALMCLAEGLLRIPDDETADRLIADKIAAGDWSAHAGASSSTFVNASTWALMLTGRLIEPPHAAYQETASWLQTLSRRLTAPVLRAAFRRAMRIIGGEFVVGRTIQEALARSARTPELSLCSYDMLGEGARTWADAQRYLTSYEHALRAIADQRVEDGIHDRSSLSVKLSALEPRYDLLHTELVIRRLVPIVTDLARSAAESNVGLTFDAEEADRLDLSLSVFEALVRQPDTRVWQGLGIVVQAYGKRAPLVIEWLAAIARSAKRRICVRLVKGAYWDSEIKRAQERGLTSYPVYTRKATTDLAYLACAERLFNHRDVLYPQFATHNAHTIASVMELAPPGAQFEFQRLHGMGKLLYDEARKQIEDFPRVRTYAPVGHHAELLSYLVRRLLENGANSSFVNRFMNERVPIEEVVQDPIVTLETATAAANPQIPLPSELFGVARENSLGVDWGNPKQVDLQCAALRGGALQFATPTSIATILPSPPVEVRNPAQRAELIGHVSVATQEDIALAFDKAAAAQQAWDTASASYRAERLIAAAKGLRENRPALIRLLVKEAGKTLSDAIAEVREAEDFCRYYAALAKSQFAPTTLPGPTGEDNTLRLRGRGVFACISPWNFPLAIFMGQVTAALVAGNSVVAKPAESTRLIAALAVQILHDAGVPHDVLQFVPASGRPFGEVAFQHPALAGVCFTGSTSTAQFINRALAARDGAIVPLIAETGGINAMLVDSSALLEQVVDDVLASAFTSAGQRCSALRLLFVHEGIADRLIELIVGGMDELLIGDPSKPSTDIGPVISETTAANLEKYCRRQHQSAGVRLLRQCDVSSLRAEGSYFGPCLLELNDARQLQSEEFGPILHVVRYSGNKLDEVIASIHDAGYGLTLGVHTRVDSVWQHIAEHMPVGNIYVNRNMIGAVVGVQPFGGERLSGTGPKAGGPHYLLRFATERTLTVNTVATGGNARLLSLVS